MTNNHEYSLKTKSVRGVASNTQAIYSSWAPLVKVSSQNHPECFSSDPKIPHIPTKEDQVGPKRWQTGGRKVADRWQKQGPFSGTYFCHLSATPKWLKTVPKGNPNVARKWYIKQALLIDQFWMTKSRLSDPKWPDHAPIRTSNLMCESEGLSAPIRASNLMCESMGLGRGPRGP